MAAVNIRCLEDVQLQKKTGLNQTGFGTNAHSNFRSMGE